LSLPSTSKHWAIQLGQVWKQYSYVGGRAQYPIDLDFLALEYPKQLFPKEPITMVQGNDFSSSFDGMLLKKPNSLNEWGILYNNAIPSKGRINFTKAHELGHYFLHRDLAVDGTIQCSKEDMYRWHSSYTQMETEANTFASFLLVPLDDFREQIKGQETSLELFEHLSHRYGVSLTVILLKWLSITTKIAMLVVGKDGHIDWSWSNEEALKRKIYFKARQETTALPQSSMANMRSLYLDSYVVGEHPKGVWSDEFASKEMTVFSDYHDLSISLIIYIE